MVRGIIGLFVCALVVRDAAAQDVSIGGAVDYASHRFADTPDTDRLDGAAAGLTILGGARFWRYAAARLEWARGGPMTDVESFTLDVAGRAVSVSSSVLQRTRSVTALGGFTHGLSSNMRITYLIGTAFTHIERRFETNAPGLILPAPPMPSALSIQEDDFVALAAGVDATIRLYEAIHAMAGLRVQPLKLDPELTGRRATGLAGILWVFR